MATGSMVSRYNIAPGSQIHSVRLQENGEPVFDFGFWGFKPSWADAKAPEPINARIESLTPSRYFQKAFQGQRCAIPANGWFEWMKTGDGRKQPYYITCPELEEGEALMFAGIYTPTATGTGIRIAIITEPASYNIRHIHDRQPVLIHPDSLERWQDPNTSAKDLKNQIQRTSSDSLAWWPVTEEVNNPKNDSASLVKPL